MSKIIKTTAQDFKTQILEKKNKKQLIEENKILKSNNRCKLLCWLEYTSIILSINIRDKLGYCGYSKYSHYRVSDNTINKLINHGFIVHRYDEYGWGITGNCFRLQINWPGLISS